MKTTGSIPALVGWPLLLALTLVATSGAASPDSPGGDKGTSAAGSGTAPAEPRRPVVVEDFAFAVENLRADRGPRPPLVGRGPAKELVGGLRPQESPAQKAARLAELLSQTIAAELGKAKVPATRQARGQPWPGEGLVVTGEFLEVDEGDRLRRAVVGFGAGATEVLVQVAIYDLARSRDQPAFVYGTGTGSKPTPGGVVAMNPYAMAARYVLSRNATEKDVRRLGRQIARDLAALPREAPGPKAGTAP